MEANSMTAVEDICNILEYASIQKCVRKGSSCEYDNSSTYSTNTGIYLH